MRHDRANDKERFAHMLKGWVDQFAHLLVTSDAKNYIQQFAIEPFMEYILQRAFPYMIIVVSVFCVILILVLLTFVLLLFRQNQSHLCPFCERTF